jgi:predicted Zn-dependent protease
MLAGILVMALGGGQAGMAVIAAGQDIAMAQFLQFSRGSEREADFLGLQYMYKTGYDPLSFVSFFEKVSAQEKKKPGLLSRAFATHPMTKDRISLAQKEIQGLLPVHDQYVLSTSEFDHVKTHLKEHSNPTIDASEGSDNRPQLKRKAQTLELPTEGEQAPAEDVPKLTRNP